LNIGHRRVGPRPGRRLRGTSSTSRRPVNILSGRSASTGVAEGRERVSIETLRKFVLAERFAQNDRSAMRLRTVRARLNSWIDCATCRRIDKLSKRFDLRQTQGRWTRDRVSSPTGDAAGATQPGFGAQDLRDSLKMVSPRGFTPTIGGKRCLCLHEQPIRVRIAGKRRHVCNCSRQALRISNSDGNRVVERIVVPVHLGQCQRL